MSVLVSVALRSASGAAELCFPLVNVETRGASH